MPPARILDYFRECAAAIDTTMAGMTGTTYLSHASLFDDVTETVFIDRFGHVTEKANHRIATALVKEIMTHLERRCSRWCSDRVRVAR